MRKRFVMAVDISEDAIFGTLIADLKNAVGSIAVHPEHQFYRLSPIEQSDLIDDWVGLLNGLRESLDHQAKGTIQ